MAALKPLFLFLHIAAMTLWVGGMFFAYVCLRPVAAAQLEPPARLTLWCAVFERFLKWVWVAVVALLFTGLGMFHLVGAGAPMFYHLMLATGLVMMAVFAHVYFAPFQRLRRAVAAKDWPAGGAALGQIRQLVGINLTLGFVTIAIATLGRLL